MSKLTFVNSGVLIAAARGAHEVARLAMTVLDDPDRTLASSALVRLEVLPKALRHHRESEVKFYETFFQSVSAWAPIGEPLAEEAFSQARKFDLHAMDALHIAAALSVGPKSSSPAKGRKSRSISSLPLPFAPSTR